LEAILDKRISRVLLIALLAALGTTALVWPFARAQVRVTPSYVPLGVAASAGGSAAWFHHQPSGAVVACQTAAAPSGSLSGIQCVTAKLP